jgi:uncharacterized protein
VSGPTLIPPSEWVPFVLGESESTPLKSTEEVQHIINLLLRWHNQIAQELQDDAESFSPHIASIENAEKADARAATLWACGYFDAMQLRFNDWAPLTQGEDVGILKPIIDLVEASPRGKKRFAEKKAERAAQHLVDSVIDIYDFWLGKRIDDVIEQSQTIRRETPKVGRNEPCPCGSGKKYKRCCSPVHGV